MNRYVHELAAGGSVVQPILQHTMEVEALHVDDTVASIDNLEISLRE